MNKTQHKGDATASEVAQMAKEIVINEGRKNVADDFYEQSIDHLKYIEKELLPLEMVKEKIDRRLELHGNIRLGIGFLTLLS